MVTRLREEFINITVAVGTVTAKIIQAMKTVDDHLPSAMRCCHGAVSPCFKEKRQNASTCHRAATAQHAHRRDNNDARVFGFCILFGIAIQSLCFADVAKLPAEDRKVLLDSSRFHEVHSIGDLPPAIVALCADDKGKLADPGQNWNATDVVTDVTLPWKRLVWAAVGSDYYAVHYERGGIDHSFHILVAKFANGNSKPAVIWHAVGRQFKDYMTFVDALRSGKLDDRLNYPR